MMRSGMNTKLRSPSQLAWLVALLAVFAMTGANAEDHSFLSNGVRLRYLVQGHGAPVVLVHGMTLDVESQWGEAGIMKALAKDYQVIAFDCRGHGRSDKPHEPAAYGLEMVEDVRRLLDELHITKAHIVGYSLGSSVALKFLTAHPERCLSAVLGDGAVYHDGYDFSAEEKAARSAAMVSDPAQVRPMPPPEASAEVVRRRDAWVAMPHDFKAYAAVFQSLSALKVAEAELRSNQVPVLGLFTKTNSRTDYLTKHLSNFKAGFVGGSHEDAFLRPEFIAQAKEFLDAHKIQKNKP
jgi:pimeloyl-ACP methyl ester carboxylesterase